MISSSIEKKYMIEFFRGMADAFVKCSSLKEAQEWIQARKKKLEKAELSEDEQGFDLMLTRMVKRGVVG
jgi:hypothetical protein